MERFVRAYLGLGANQGDRSKTLREARNALDNELAIRVCASSALYESEAAEGAVGQPAFLNTVLAVETGLGPHELLKACLRIEEQFGRIRQVRHGARTLDIDLLLYAEEQVNMPDLVVPHPRLAQRGFVLQPLIDLLPSGRHPVSGKRFADLLANLPAIKIPTFMEKDW